MCRGGIYKLRVANDGLGMTDWKLGIDILI